MTVVEHSPTDAFLEASEIVHYVCCDDDQATFCGIEPVGGFTSDPVDCVVCLDVNAAAEAGLGCPFGRGCRPGRLPS